MRIGERAIVLIIMLMGLLVGFSIGGLMTSKAKSPDYNPHNIIPANDRQNISRYYDEKSGVVCYILTNKQFTWWYQMSCLPVDQIKDLP